jgi:hypothetical protein
MLEIRAAPTPTLFFCRRRRSRKSAKARPTMHNATGMLTSHHNDEESGSSSSSDFVDIDSEI